MNFRICKSENLNQISVLYPWYTTVAKFQKKNYKNLKLIKYRCERYLCPHIEISKFRFNSVSRFLRF